MLQVLQPEVLQRELVRNAQINRIAPLDNSPLTVGGNLDGIVGTVAVNIHGGKHLVLAKAGIDHLLRFIQVGQACQQRGRS